LDRQTIEGDLVLFAFRLILSEGDPAGPECKGREKSAVGDPARGYAAPKFYTPLFFRFYLLAFCALLQSVMPIPGKRP
jgi:hypothetical protein